MADIALVFTDYGGGDLVMNGQDLLRDDGLESAILVSLFTDRRAGADQLRAGDDPDDRRGWWGDFNAAVEGDRTGSLLWLLRREKQTRETLARARQFAEQALAWMIEDRVALAVSVQTSYMGQGVLRLDVDITRPTGPPTQYRYDYEWQAQAAKRAA